MANQRLSFKRRKFKLIFNVLILIFRAAVAQLFAQLLKCKKTSEVTDAGSDLPGNQFIVFFNKIQFRFDQNEAR